MAQRTIKFRGKSIETGKWVYGCLVNNLWCHAVDKQNVVEIIPDAPQYEITCWSDVEESVVEVLPESLGQSTGLHDTSNTLIFEGDILQYESQNPNRKGQKFNNVVEFASGQQLVGWRMRNGRCVVKATPYKFGRSKVIGNIHDNPKLLKS